MEIHRRGFDQLRCGERLRSREVEDNVISELSDDHFGDAHFIDAIIEFVDPLFDVSSSLTSWLLASRNSICTVLPPDKSRPQRITFLSSPRKNLAAVRAKLLEKMLFVGLGISKRALGRRLTCAALYSSLHLMRSSWIFVSIRLEARRRCSRSESSNVAYLPVPLTSKSSRVAASKEWTGS